MLQIYKMTEYIIVLLRVMTIHVFLIQETCKINLWQMFVILDIGYILIFHLTWNPSRNIDFLLHAAISLLTCPVIDIPRGRNEYGTGVRTFTQYRNYLQYYRTLIHRWMPNERKSHYFIKRRSKVYRMLELWWFMLVLSIFKAKTVFTWKKYAHMDYEEYDQQTNFMKDLELIR